MEKGINMQAISERIISVRKRLKLKQQEFGQKIGLSQALVTRLENGERKLDVNTIAILHEDFNVSIHYILFGQGDMFNSGELINKPIGESTDVEKAFKKLLSYTDYLENEIEEYKKDILTFKNALDAKGIDIKELLSGGSKTAAS